jgi:ferredoxin
MKAEVERDRCEGHGVCEQAAPDVFRLDDGGSLVILQEDVPAELEGRVEAAVRACPVAALRAVR